MTGPAGGRLSRASLGTRLWQWLVVLLAAGAATVSVHATAAPENADSPDADAAPDDTGTGDRDVGRELYTTNCAMCHGADGGGGAVRDGRPADEGRRVPPLDDSTVSKIRLVLETGRMPPTGDPFDSRARSDELDPQQREAIVAYVTEQFDLDGDVPPPPEGDPARGQELYAGNCAACHGSTGGGGVAGRGAFTPALTDYDAQTIADAARTGPFEMPQFGSGQLTDAEVGHIAAFLDHVQHEEFAPLWDAELGPVYASAFVVALVVAVLILTLVVAGRPVWFPSDEHRTGRDGSGEDEPNERAPNEGAANEKGSDENGSDDNGSERP